MVSSTEGYSASVQPFDPRTDYPIGTRRPDLIRTPSGLSYDELTLDNLRRGQIPEGDFRATPETLRLQADVARATGRSQLADNLERAAELTVVPDHVILEIYTSLRPGRSSDDELEAWADRLEHEDQAPLVAAFIREARRAYEERGLLI